MKLSNLTNRITVADYDLTKANGLWVCYDLDGIEKNLIETDEQNICELLKGIGVVEGCKLSDGLVCVKVETADERYHWINYDDFLFTYEISQKDARDIALLHEGNLIGQQITREKDEMLKAIDGICTTNG